MGVTTKIAEYQSFRAENYPCGERPEGISMVSKCAKKISEVLYFERGVVEKAKGMISWLKLA